MKLLSLAAAIVELATVAPASAGVVLSDNFDAENGGATAGAYTGFANFNVTVGTVDILSSGFLGINCVGGVGSCVDLDGSSNAAGELVTKNSYAFSAGDLVSLSIQLSGNQRGGFDDFSFGFNASVATLFNNVIVTGPFGPAPVNVGNLGPGLFLGSGRPTGPLGLVAAGEPFTTYSLSFVAGNAGTLTAFVNTGGGDNVGPILDNFELSIGGAVPEPESWAMMVVGFALVGATARRTPRLA